MTGDSLVRLFGRFRDSGDVTALGEIFDEIAPELLRVARHVAPRAVEPHDLVQATFLIAIERAASYDRSRPLEAWLLGILTKEAAYERRRGARVVEPDRLDQHGVIGPAERVSDRELREAVGAALEALPEKYRAVVGPAVLDGAHPRDIARRSGQRAGTVRVQLHRGLRMLRDALPAGFALGAAVTASTGLAEARTRVLLHASRGSSAAVSAGSTAGLLAWLAARWQVAAGAALVAAAVWTIAWIRGTDPGATAVRAAGAVEPDRSGTELTAGGRTDRTAVAGPAGAGDRPPARVLLVGRVLGLDHRPSERAAVELRVAGAGPFRTHTLADGSFRLRAELAAGQPAEGGLVAVGPGGRVEVIRFRFAPGAASERYVGTIVLGEAVDLPVRVVDEAGRPVPGAEVVARVRDTSILGAITDGAGRALVRGVPRVALAVVARSGERVGTLEEVRRPARGVTVRLGEGTPPPLPPPARGGPQAVRAGVEILLRLHCDGRVVWHTGDARFVRASRPYQVSPAGDGDVSVWLAGAAAGDEVVLDVEPAGFRPATARVRLEPGPLPTLLDLRLDSLASLVARVDRPPDARISLELQRWGSGLGSWGPTNLDWGGLMAPNTDAGEFRFDGLEPATYRVRERDTGLCSDPVAVETGTEVVRASLDLTVLSRIRGRVVVPDATDLRLVRILVEAEGVDFQVNRRTPHQRYQWTVRVDEDGRFSVRVPTDRPVFLRAVHPLLVPASGRGAVEITDPGAELVIELSRGSEVRLPLAGLDPTGPGRIRVLLYPGEGEATPSGEPRARYDPLIEGDVARFAGPPPGLWTFWVDVGPGTHVRPAVLQGVAVGSSTTLLPPLPLEAGSSVRFRLEGNRPGYVAAFARRHGEPTYSRTASTAADGELILTGLGPGRFTIHVGSPSTVGPLLETEIELDGEHDVELAVRMP